MTPLRSSVLRRGAGVILMAAVVAPWWRLADPAGSALLADTIRRSDRLLIQLWWQTGVLIAVGAVVAAVLGHQIDRLAGSLASAMRRLPTPTFATGAGILGAAHTAIVSWIVWDGRPPLTDAWAQVIQARYLAAVRLAAPPEISNAFHIVANTFVTDAGWTAQYPPGHPVLLALGYAAGVPWLVGPILVGATVAIVVLLGERLIPDSPIVGRLAGLVTASGPLLVLPSAAYLSHAPAAFWTVLAAYAAVRARNGGPAWAALAGLSIGAAFLTRPLTGVTVTVVAAAGAWLATPVGGRTRHQIIVLAGLAGVGALLPVLLGLWYNATLFGSPFAFGYTAYLGEGHAPGWHPNPWGNPYAIREAVAFTAADLTALGPALLRTPISGVFVVGAFLAVATRITRPLAVTVIWAGVAVINAAAYWHHDLLLGPRMLADAGPAWSIALVASTFGIVGLLPVHRGIGGRATGQRWGKAVVTIAAIYGVVVGPVLTIRNLDRTFPPPPAAPQSPGPALVFVHDSWNARLAARLGATGMRADSIAALLRTSDPCTVQTLLERRERAETSRQSRGVPASTPGSRCAQEERADRFGGLPLMPLIWQGDLPGLPARRAMFVRDLGPDANEQLLARYPDRRPAMLVQRPPGPTPAIVPYADGMALLWGPEGSTGR